MESFLAALAQGGMAGAVLAGVWVGLSWRDKKRNGGSNNGSTPPGLIARCERCQERSITTSARVKALGPEIEKATEELVKIRMLMERQQPPRSR